MTKREPPFSEDSFLATASHEIRTPLNGILGMASLLAETKLSQAQKGYVDAIRESGGRLLDLLNNVLDYARLNNGEVEIEREAFDPAALAREVVELLSPRAHAANLDLAVRQSSDTPGHVVGDVGRSRQILFNLVGNALKFTEQGGVLIDIDRFDGGLRFRVIDTGPGIPEHARATLFEAFRQNAVADAYKDGGVGLGLAIVQRLTAQLGGGVEIGGAPGLGADFAATLPFPAAGPPIRLPALTGAVAVVGVPPASALAAASALQQAGAAVRLAETPEAVAGLRPDAVLAGADLPRRVISALAEAAPTLIVLRPEDRGALPRFRELGCIGWLLRPLRPGSVAERVAIAMSGGVARDEDPDRAPPGARVLIADDNPVNALIAQRALEKSGFDATVAATGVEALEAAAAERFAMILMDLRMPVMDGFEATKRLRERGDETPVVAISAEVNPVIERRALAAGANVVAAKPMDVEALRRLAAKWSNPAQAAAE